MVTLFAGAATAARPGKPSVAERLSCTVVPLGVVTGMETENDCDSVRVARSFVAGVLLMLPALLVSANDCTATSSVAAALTLIAWPAYSESGVALKVVMTGGAL